MAARKVFCGTEEGDGIGDFNAERTESPEKGRS